MNVSIKTPGKLEISPEPGIEFYMRERIELENSNKTTYVYFKDAYLSVVDPVFEVWKKGEVRI